MLRSVITSFILSVTVVNCLPNFALRRIAEISGFNDFENILPRYDSFPDIHSGPNELNDDFLSEHNKTERNSNVKVEANKTSSTKNSSMIILAILQNATDPKNLSTTTLPPILKNKIIVTSNVTENYEQDVPNNATEIIDVNRDARQEVERDDPEFASKEKESQEEDSEEENMLTGLISAFLGGLSRPDGSIDLEAIVGLLGSLSTQNPDGSYDFQGLTDLLRGFFGGGDDGGGGSDIGAFVGGLLGAIIKGVANPEGAKGAGIFTGNILGGILPALSAPAPSSMEGADNKKKGPQLDVGGFLQGLLKTLLSGSSGADSQGNGGSKFTFIKTIVSAVTSVFAASSKKGD